MSEIKKVTRKLYKVQEQMEDVKFNIELLKAPCAKSEEIDNIVIRGEVTKTDGHDYSKKHLVGVSINLESMIEVYKKLLEDLKAQETKLIYKLYDYSDLLTLDDKDLE